VIFKAAVEIAALAKIGTWTAGTSNEYIVAIEQAAAQGLIERDGQKVRAKLVVVEKKAVQKGLFDAE
jgi:hypothetical protein